MKENSEKRDTLFSIEYLTTPPEPPVDTAHAEEELEEVKLFMSDDSFYDTDWDENSSEGIRKKIDERVSKGWRINESDLGYLIKDAIRIKDIPLVGELYRKAISVNNAGSTTLDDEENEEILDKILDGFGSITENDIEALVVLNESGLKLEEADYSGFRSPIVQYFFTEYKKDPDPNRIKSLFEEYIKEHAKAIVPKLADGIKKAVLHIKEKAKEKGQKQMFEDNVYGIYFYLTGIRVNDSSGKDIVDIENKELKKVSGSLIFQYIDKDLLAALHQLDAAGEFDGLREDVFVIYQWVNKKEEFYRKQYSGFQAARQEFEKKIELLETGEYSDADILLLKNTIDTYLEGVFLPVDTDRALNILLQLYSSHNEDAKQQADKLLKSYYSNYPKWGYEYALLMQKNGNLLDAVSGAYRSREKGYEPAVNLHKKLKIEFNKNKVAQGRTNFSTNSVDDIPRIMSQMFTPGELLLKTENVLAKANYQGGVVIRFLEENEQAYSEALNFINSIMKKGYSSLLSGYRLEVEFINDPEYIQGVELPVTSAHEFFANAARYPSLHLTMVEYIDAVMNMYDWYKDGSECMPGFFAAVALMMTDKNYLRLAGDIRSACDSDHMYIQNVLPKAIAKKWPDEPAMFKAVDELLGCMQFDSPIPVPKNMFANIDSAKAYLEAYETEICRDFDSIHWFFIAKNKNKALSKLKEYADKTNTTENKNVYVKLYNYLREYKTPADKRVGEPLDLFVE